MNCSLLWAFMVQNFWIKIHFQWGKSRKKGISVIKITFYLQKIPENYRFPWVNTKTINILAGLILHSCGVWSLEILFHYFIYQFIEITSNNCIKNKKGRFEFVLKSSVFKSFQWRSNCLKLKNKFLMVSG